MAMWLTLPSRKIVIIVPVFGRAVDGFHLSVTLRLLFVLLREYRGIEDSGREIHEEDGDSYDEDERPYAHQASSQRWRPGPNDTCRRGRGVWNLERSGIHYLPSIIFQVKHYSFT